MTQWRDIEGYEGYQVSDDGQVRGVRSEHLSQECLHTGYRRVGLYIAGVRRKVLVHVLVTAAFLGRKPSGVCINHRDGDKSNNALSNLEYVTPSQNQRHAYATGLRRRMSGESHHQSKLTEGQVHEIRALRRAGLSLKEIGSRFGVGFSNVSKICTNQSWAESDDAADAISFDGLPANPEVF